MSIPRRANPHVIIPLKESRIPKNKSFLLEKAHAYDRQYKWAWKCSLYAYNMAAKGGGISKIKFESGDENDIKGIILNVTTDEAMPSHAFVNGFNNYGIFELRFAFNNADLPDANDKKNVIYRVWTSLVHELAHCNIFWKRSINRQPFKEAGELYAIATKVITDNTSSENNILLYDFCYACYSTYYQEIQALISEGFSSLLSYAKTQGVKKEDITKEQFLDFLTHTKPYIAFHANLKLCKTLNGKNSTRLKEKIIKDLDELGYHFSEFSLNKKIKEIEELSSDALKLAYNNAYQWFYQSFGHN